MSFGFKNLEVWKVSKSFAKDEYELTSYFPSEEKFGLVAQLRRAAISVMSNIAEGAGRKHKKEFDHFLYLARGSLNETVAQLEISSEFGYLKENQLDLIEEKAERINRMLWKLSKSLEKSEDR
ncbi:MULTISPECIES: four helix bundle protein [unclassified Mesotoga]|uniref:four helix bundle protein n=1 Tax=unclassified Mesotoga TaxID=1184398 RepID=UPI000DB8C1FE|nr:MULTISPECIES: four helix bundle protein [unclassified Mesotoga]PZC51836.1 30S ribosomal protein S23 [Mesotoga sp. TolDC]